MSAQTNQERERAERLARQRLGEIATGARRTVLAVELGIATHAEQHAYAADPAGCRAAAARQSRLRDPSVVAR